MDILLALAEYIGCIIACLFIADFITGLMHWAEDAWLAPGKSALLDRYIVNDNIDHHRYPGKIRAGNYWATNRVCITLAAIGALPLLLLHVTAWEPYLILAIVSQSNQFHLWGHTSQPPQIVGWLQRIGILQPARHHAGHHKSPYAARYCIVTTYLNPILDGAGFWRLLESIAVNCGATVQRASVARGGY